MKTGADGNYVWRIAADTPDYAADDATGEGARCNGGRWNRAGTAAVYSSGSIALACLETIMHLNMAMLPLNRYLVRIDIPTDVWRQRTIFDAATQVGWDALPAGRVSLDYGDRWLQATDSALLEVPSVIVPEENNIIINPRHPDARVFKYTKLRKWHYDARLRGT